MTSLLFLLLVFVLVFLRFRVDDRPSGRVDMDFGDFAVGAQDLDFPDRLAVFLFELSFYDGSWDLFHGGFDRLLGRDLRVFHEIGDVAFLVVAPGDRARADDQARWPAGLLMLVRAWFLLSIGVRYWVFMFAGGIGVAPP